MDETEDINEYSMDIDKWGIYKIAEFIHLSDIKAYEAVGMQMHNISRLIEFAVNSIISGGRVVYVGAGTSGRIAAQDVIELKPTYGLGKESFDYIIAGGVKALSRSIEGSEDDHYESVNALKAINLNKNDLVIGISASGNTPFVISALNFASELGCRTAGITCNSGKQISKVSDPCIELITGAEVIQGSTRMKAGTAQKMVLNIISTTVAIKLGRTYKNTMSNMEAWYNQKLRSRALSILVNQFGLNDDEALNILKKFNYDLSKAIKYINNKN